MEKAKKDADVIAVAVTRLGSDPVAIKLDTDRTVRAALKKANVTVASNAQLFVDGQRAELEDVLQEGDVLSIVTPKQAGSK